MDETILLKRGDARITITGPTVEKAEKVYRDLLDFLNDHGVWSGTDLLNDDQTMMDIPDFIAGLIDDVVQPKVTYGDA